MSESEIDREGQEPLDTGEYPLRDTAAFLNDRLGLYLSEDQQRGLAAGLLIGTALGAAILAWNIVGLARRGD